MTTKVYIGRMRVKKDWFKLTSRQQEITLMVIQGFTNRQVADKLHITEQTVKDHLHDIFAKIGARNRTELAIKLLGPPEDSEGK